MFSVREFKQEDYKEYSNWLRIRNRLVTDENFLSKTGLIVSENENNLAAGFLIDTNTKAVAIGNLASDPLADNLKRSLAVDFLLESLINLAKEKEYKFVFVTTNREKLVERLIKKQFNVFDRELVQLGKEI